MLLRSLFSLKLHIASWLIKRYALNDAIRYLDVLRHYHAASRPAPESSSFMNSALALKFRSGPPAVVRSCKQR
jgi:hypothetical protein